MGRLGWVLLCAGLGFGQDFRILYTGSSNGNLRECRSCPEEPYGGLPRRKSLIDSLKGQDPELLCFDTGNLFSPFGDRFKDSLFFLGFDRIGYDAVGIGDQELIHGVDFLSRLLATARNPFTSANLYHQETNLVAPYLIREARGLRVGVISLLDPMVLSFYPEAQAQGVSIRDPIEALSELLPRLRPEVDLLVILSNLGEELEKRVASRFHELDILISGRSRERFDPPRRIGEVVHLSPGPGGRWVGVLRVGLAQGRITGIKNELIALSEAIPSDPELYELTEHYFRRHQAPAPEVRAEGPVLILFYGPDCEHCLAIMHDYLPRLQARYRFSVEYRSVEEPENYRALVELEERYAGGREQPLPVILVGDTILGGERPIRMGLESRLKVLIGGERPKPTPPPPRGPEPEVITELVYFYQAGCPACDRVEYSLKALRDEFPGLRVHRVDLEKEKGLAEGFGIFYRVPEPERLIAPSVFIGNQYLIKEVQYRRLKELIEANLGAEIPWDEVRALIPEAEHSIITRFRSFGPLGVMGAGLLDGINPCAITTIGFFIAYLGVLGLAGRRILVAGLSFVLAVFAVYLGIGLGAYRFLDLILRMRTVARWVVGTTGIAVLVFAGLSFYDFYWARRRELTRLILQLPGVLKDQIHRSVRRHTTLGGYILGSFVTGGMVSVLELACTGQVYLPTIVFVAQMPGLRAHGVFYLILYNLCFILPLVGAFLLAYFGVSSQKSQQLFARHLPLVKFSTGCFFLMLGGVLLSTLVG